MNSEHPATQLHHTAICPQQPINLWTGQRVISYLTWRLLMCTEVKHFQWRMRESNERLHKPHPGNYKTKLLQSWGIQVDFFWSTEHLHHFLHVSLAVLVFFQILSVLNMTNNFFCSGSRPFLVSIFSVCKKRNMSTASRVLKLVTSTSAVFKWEWFSTRKTRLTPSNRANLVLP